MKRCQPSRFEPRKTPQTPIGICGVYFQSQKLFSFFFGIFIRDVFIGGF
jgi:hypothetical protein